MKAFLALLGIQCLQIGLFLLLQSLHIGQDIALGVL